MANYRGHTAGAIVLCAAYVFLLIILPINFMAYTVGLLDDWQFVASMFVLALLFGLWPDVDTNSVGQNIVMRSVFTLDILLIWQGYFEAAAYLGLLALTPIIGKHRGWTHSKLAVYKYLRPC